MAKRRGTTKNKPTLSQHQKDDYKKRLDAFQNALSRLSRGERSLDEDHAEVRSTLADLTAFEQSVGIETSIDTRKRKIDESLGHRHQIDLANLQATAAESSDEARFESVERLEKRSFVSKDTLERLSARTDITPITESLKTYQARLSADFQRKRAHLKRMGLTEFRGAIDVSAATMEVTPEGQARVRDRAKILGDLGEKGREIREKLQATPEGERKDLAREQLIYLENKKNDLRIAITRDTANQIREESQAPFTESEVSSDGRTSRVWSRPRLVTQQESAKEGLQRAQQLQAQLKADPNATPEQQKTANQLLQKMVDQLMKIDGSIKQGQEALKKSVVENPILSKIIKRRDGEEDVDYAERLATTGAKARAISSSIFAAVETAVQTTAAMKEMTFDLPRRTVQTTSAVEATRQSQILDALSFSPESRARFGGDILFGDRTLGASGHRLAGGMAREELDRRRNAEKWALGGAGAQFLLGAAATIGGGAALATGFGAPIGIASIAGGIGMMTSALPSAAKNTALQETGFLDFAGPFKASAEATRRAQIQESKDALISAAVERNKLGIAGQAAHEKSLETWAQNIRTGGGFLAVDPRSLIPAATVSAEEIQASVRPLGDAGQRFGEGGIDLKRSAERFIGAIGTGGILGVDFDYAAQNAQKEIEIQLAKEKNAGATDKKLIERRKELEENLKPFLMSEELNKQRGEAITKNAVAIRDLDFVKYGMTADEWSTRITNVSANVLGAGATQLSQAGRTAATTRLYEMGLAGLGSFEQLSGNAAAIASLTGKTDPTKDLEKVLAKAVKTGFDDSRTGQAFVQASTNMAASLGLRSVSEASLHLSRATRLMGGTEQDMQAFTRGAAQLPNMFEQNRVVGGLNFASFVASGGLGLEGPTAQSAFEISKNPMRALKVKNDIGRLKTALAKAGGKDDDDTRMKVLGQQEFKDIDPELRDRLIQGGFAGLDAFDLAASSGLSTMGGLTGQQEKVKQIFARMQKGYAGKDGPLKGRAAQAALENARIEASKLFRATGSSREEANAAAYASLFGNLNDKEIADLERNLGGKGSLKALQDKGTETAQQAAVLRREQVAAQAALVSLGKGEAQRQLTAYDIETMSKDGKFTFKTKDAKGKEFSQEIGSDVAQKIARGEKGVGSALENSFQNFLKSSNAQQAALQQSMSTALESVAAGQTQQVYVMNWAEMVQTQRRFAQIPGPGTSTATTEEK